MMNPFCDTKRARFADERRSKKHEQGILPDFCFDTKTELSTGDSA